MEYFAKSNKTTALEFESALLKDKFKFSLETFPNFLGCDDRIVLQINDITKTNSILNIHLKFNNISLSKDTIYPLKN